MLAAALMFPAMIVSAATAATVWILRGRRARRTAARLGTGDGDGRSAHAGRALGPTHGDPPDSAGPAGRGTADRGVARRSPPRAH